MISPLEISKSNDPRRIEFNGIILVAHQPECMPWLGNLSKATMGDVYLILDTVQFVKEHWQNRNKIRMKGGIGYQWLTIPVYDVKKHLMLTNDVRISPGIWKRKHLKAFELAYRRAPYFDEIINDLQKIYSFEDELLVDFLMRFIHYAFKMFQIDIPVYRTSELIKAGYKIEGIKSNLILDMCKAVGADIFVFGRDGRTYIDKEVFYRNNIKFIFQEYNHPRYNQIQGDFISHMSFLDLLFNYGRNSINVLGKSNYLEK